MKCFSGDAWAEIHDRKIEKAKRSGDGGFLDMTGMDKNLVVCSNQIDLGEEKATRQLMTVVMGVTDWITVWNNLGVQRSVVSIGMPTVVLLGHDMWCRGSATLIAERCAVPQHGAELGFSDGESVWCQSTWWAGD
jgi:hypothetical protein